MFRTAFIAMCLLLHLSAMGQELSQAKELLQRQAYGETIGLLTALANRNDAEAQRLLGEMIFKGQGVRKNMKAAFTWTELAAKNGDPIGQFNLGHFYEHGLGVAASTEQATKWYERSASQAFLLAQRRLGELYAKTNPKRALYWYNEARMQGDESVMEPLTKIGVLEAEKASELRKAERVAEEREQTRRSREIEQVRAREERQRRNVAAGISRDFQQLGHQMAEQSQRIGAAARGTTVEAERASHERIAERERSVDGFSLTATSSPEKRAVAVSEPSTDYQTWRETCGGMCTREQHAKMMAEQAARDARRKSCVHDGGACTTSK